MIWLLCLRLLPVMSRVSPGQHRARILRMVSNQAKRGILEEVINFNDVCLDLKVKT